MKRALAILILCVYTLLSVISYVGIHYCHGHIQSITINNHHHLGCVDNESAKCCNACDDLLIEIDFTPDQNKVEPIKIDKVFESELFFTTLIQSCLIFPNEVIISIKEESSPKVPLPDLYLLNSSFLFYG